MKNNNSMARFLKGLLSFIFFIVVVTTVMMLFSIDTVKSMITRISITAIFLVIIYDLRIIIDTVIRKNPFILNNVKRFKRIEYLIFLLGLVDIIVNFNNGKGALLIGTPYGNIHFDTLLYFVIGGMALILAQVFQLAIELKEENDLTI